MHVLDYNHNHDPKSGEFASGSEPSQEEVDALYEYVDMSTKLNAGLRGQRQLTPMEQTTANRIDAFMARQSLPQSELVYRGVSGNFAKTLDSLKVGDVMVDKAFTSTSLKRDVAKEFGKTEMHITIPKGAKARYVSDLMGDPAMTAEKEILLARNSRLQYTGKVVNIGGTVVHSFNVIN